MTFEPNDIAALADAVAERLTRQPAVQPPAGLIPLDDVAALFGGCDRDTARQIMSEAGIAAVKVPGFRRTVYSRAAVAVYVARLEADARDGRRPTLRRAS